MPLVVDTLITQNQKDAEGEFYRRLDRHGSCGSVMIITADGKSVDQSKGWEAALEAFKKLPKEQRTPVVGELTNRDMTAPLNQLKPRTLRLKIWSRALQRDDAGEFSPMRWTWDWSHGPGGAQALPAGANVPKADYDPGYDYLWLDEAEWRLLVPKNTTVGSRFPLPQEVVPKMACDALNHTGLMRMPSTLWKVRSLRNLSLNLLITEASPAVIRMMLQGTVLHESPREEAPYWRDESRLCRKHSFSNGDAPLKYDARVLGYLDFDRQKDEFTRFDIVSVGDYVAFYGNANEYGHILNHQLGVAFAIDPGPAVPPAKWHRRQDAVK